MAAIGAKQQTSGWAYASAVFLVAAVVLTFTWVGPAAGFQSPSAARILFFHLPVALLLVYWYLVAAVCGVRYLLSRALVWDRRAAAAAEIGLLCTVLATVSGAVFARMQWLSWWNWDPKQVAVVIVMLIYAAYFALRGAIVEHADLRARLGAVYAILGGVATPYVVKVVGQRPGTVHPNDTLVRWQLSLDYSVAFLLALAGFFCLTTWLYRLRWRQLAGEGA